MQKLIFENGALLCYEIKYSLHAQLPSMRDSPIMFQDHPLKTVGGVVFTRICDICISKYLKKGHNSVRN